MFKAIRSLFNPTGVQRDELLEFIRIVHTMDSSELGMPVVLIDHWAQEYLERKGWDFYEPHTVIASAPNSILSVGSDIRRLQVQGLQHLCSGLIPWLHTLRAAENLALRMECRMMWEQISRGFRHAEEGAQSIFELTGTKFEISGVGRFPSGFTPHPL